MADEKKLPERDHMSDVVAEWAPRLNMHAKKLKSSGIPQSIDDTDLHAAGMEGLMDAFHRYDKDKGNFVAFADKRIEGKMRDHVSASGGANIVDKYYRQQAKAFKAKQETAKPAEVAQPEVPSSTEED